MISARPFVTHSRQSIPPRCRTQLTGHSRYGSFRDCAPRATDGIGRNCRRFYVATGDPALKEWISYFRSRLLEMEGTGFPLFERIPDSRLIGSLQLYNNLGTQQRDTLKDVIATRAARWWGFPYNHHERTPAAQLFDWFLRTARPATAIEQSPRPKAPKLRKLAKLAFSLAFGASAAKLPEPGDWAYSGTALGRPIEIIIRYNTRLGQIWYSVRVDNCFRRDKFNIERLYRFGIGGWDLIDDDNVGDSVTTLCDAIEESVRDFNAVQGIIAQFEQTTSYG
jgi:hypothetical protein